MGNDLRTGKVFRSDRWWEIHGHRRDDVEDAIDPWRDWTHPEDLVAIEAELQEVFERQAPTFRIEARTRHGRGHMIPVVVRGLVEYDDAGHPIRLSGATTDVTEAKRVDAMKDEFVSTVSHELRTPLTSIGGSLQTLAAGRAGRLPDPAHGLLEVAQRNTDRLRLLIDQAIADYLSNAAKYSPPDRAVEMRMRVMDEQTRIEVIDRGPGVPDGSADRLFQRFTQADPADERSRGGTGLGLAISREIATGLGGRVGYDSEPGRTSFWVDLPVLGA